MPILYCFAAHGGASRTLTKILAPLTLEPVPRRRRLKTTTHSSVIITVRFYPVFFFGLIHLIPDRSPLQPNRPRPWALWFRRTAHSWQPPPRNPVLEGHQGGSRSEWHRGHPGFRAGLGFDREASGNARPMHQRACTREGREYHCVSRLTKTRHGVTRR